MSEHEPVAGELRSSFEERESPLPENVVLFPGVTAKDFDPDVMLQVARRIGLSQVVILGYDKEGAEYFSSSVSDGPEVVWMLERAKHFLMNVVDE
jgi:hypothetical protein